MTKQPKNSPQMSRPARGKESSANPFLPTQIEDVAGMARRKQRKLSIRDMNKAVSKEAARRR